MLNTLAISFASHSVWQKTKLELLEKASILVPSPNVAEDHQTKNAMSLVNNNAAIIIKDSETKEKLILEAIRLVNDKKEIEKLSSNISKGKRLMSDELIAKEVLKLVKTKY